MRLGVDIGGTKTDAVALDGAGVTTQRVRLVTGFGSLAVIETATAAISRIAELSGLEPSGFESIGIGIPGMVDSASGHVRHAVNLGLDGLDLGDAIAERLGVGVRIENDVSAAALGAYHGLGLTSSMAYLNLGTGMAAGLVINGELWRGPRGAAGEIGHIPVDPNGALCGCGQRGCLETVASGSGVARVWTSGDQYPVRALFDAAEAGDTQATAIRAKLAGGVAAAIRVLILTADVETVVIGGGLSHLGERLLDDVLVVLSSWSATSPFVASLELGSRVQLVPNDFPAAAVGAALVGGSLSGVA
ncbi:MAG TPA: ROK family protein [Galbitalea sp.]|jgi:predicted NBD/HSP70 family sugar kinase|nr:ROK family protein [Galbitalea sp.]